MFGYFSLFFSKVRPFPEALIQNSLWLFKKGIKSTEPYVQQLSNHKDIYSDWSAFIEHIKTNLLHRLQAQALPNAALPIS